jgi:hypothetical protein
VECAGEFAKPLPMIMLLLLAGVVDVVDVFVDANPAENKAVEVKGDINGTAAAVNTADDTSPSRFK